MTEDSSVIAPFTDHTSAEAATRKLADNGIELKHLSVVGKGYHTNEKVTGFYNMGDRVKIWGERGAFWGALWGWMFGAIFLTVPLIGPIIILGYLGTIVIATIEGAVVLGGLSVLGAALLSSGIPRNSILAYETSIKEDNFLVTAHGPVEEMARAHAILKDASASRVDLHEPACV
jgi:uncharacterized membrane protein